MLTVGLVIAASLARAVSRVAAKSIAGAGAALTLLLLSASCEGTNEGAADASVCASSDALPPTGDTGASASNGDSGTTAALDGGPVDGREDAGVPTETGSPQHAATLGVDPAMGWTSWSFVRENPTEAAILAPAQALFDSGLSSHGYTYVNIDDFYYLDPTTNADSYGRWVVDATKFPDGMQAVASYVHKLGLKFGMYLTPGIPAAAVNQSTPIEGTPYNAANIAVGGGTTAPITVAWSDLGINGAADVKDLWAHTDLGTMSGSFTANVSSHGVSLVRIQP